MKQILWAAVLAVVLALSVTLVTHWPSDPAPAATPTQTPAPAAAPTPAPVLPIEIIDGELWAAIPVEGMEEYYENQD